MSVVLSEESRAFGRPAGQVGPKKKHSSALSKHPVHPQKTFTANPTPRKALGDLSNNARTPAPNSQQKKALHQRQTHGPASLRKPTIPKSTSKPSSGTKGNREAPLKIKRNPVATPGIRPLQKPLAAMEDDFPDIEAMPSAQGAADTSDPPFVPPKYFASLTSALRMTPSVPFLSDLPELDCLSRLSLESDLRPQKRPNDYLRAPVGTTDDVHFDSFTFASLPPITMPDIPDWIDS